MTPAPVSASVQLIPSRTMRAGLPAYIGALAAIEVTDGVIVAAAWREQRQRAVIHASELRVLGEMFDRLRAIEAVVAAGAVVTQAPWSFIAVRNASTASRNGRSGASAVLSWTAAPIAVLVLAGLRHGSALQTNGVLAAQAVVMLVPFATIGVAAKRVGGSIAPFFRWYVALAMTFLVHEAFTGSFNLADPKPSNDLGRAAALMLASGLVLGLMVLMAADAARSMETATLDRMQAHRDWRADALQRFRSAVAPAARPVPVAPVREDVMAMVAAVPTMAPGSTTLLAQRAAVAQQVAQPVARVLDPVMPTPVMPTPVMPTVVAPVMPVTPTVVAPVMPVTPTVVAPAPVVSEPLPAAQAPSGNSMFAPLTVRTFPAEAPAPTPAPEPVVQQPVVQSAPAPIAIPAVPAPVVAAEPPAAADSPFAPLQPRSTPRSI